MLSGYNISFFLQIFNGIANKFPCVIIHLSFSPYFVVDCAALTFMDLGIGPYKLKGYPVEYLIQYRKGGSQFGSTVSEKVNPESWP